MSEKDNDTPQTQAPVGKGKRFFKLAGMTMSVAGNYAKTKLKTAFQTAEQAAKERAAAHSISGERIAKTLGELKGAVMKVGQMASIVNDVLPKEFTEALTGLQKEAPPMPFEVIAAQIESEFGEPPEALFEYFDETPFASASIGQVHRARTDDGREVVVKVQYPGVDESCDSDLAHLKLALRASGMIQLKRKELDKIFEEIKARLHEELDYCNEADNVRKFAEFYKDTPDIVIPEVIGERSSQRVLTLSFEPGDHISEIPANPDKYTQEIRDQIGANLFRIVCGQFFELQAIHGDPNPGNFAFRPDGSVVIYDFGCVKNILPEIAEAYEKTLQSAISEDYEGVDEGLLALGVRVPDGPPVEPEYYKDWRDLFLTPFIQKEPFDYGASTVHEGVLKRVPGVLKRLRSFQPPVELIFFDRMIVGHYGNLRKIESRGRYLEILGDYVALPPVPELS